MCGEVVAAPLSLQDTVYPILRKKSLHFCENSRKFLKLCTAVRKKYKMKRLRKGNVTPSVKTCRFCQLPLGGSLWRARKLCTLVGKLLFAISVQRRSAGPEAGRGVPTPPSLPLDSTHPATGQGLHALDKPKEEVEAQKS